MRLSTVAKPSREMEKNVDDSDLPWWTRQVPLSQTEAICFSYSYSILNLQRRSCRHGWTSISKLVVITCHHRQALRYRFTENAWNGHGNVGVSFSFYNHSLSWHFISSKILLYYLFTFSLSLLYILKGCGIVRFHVSMNWGANRLRTSTCDLPLELLLMMDSRKWLWFSKIVYIFFGSYYSKWLTPPSGDFIGMMIYV